MDAKTLRILKVYCDKGYKLVPVKEGTKRPAIKNFLEDASCDIEQLRFWAATFPNCNWGLPLKPNGLVAIDVDRKHGGLEAWDALLEHNDELPRTLSATTGSGGKHILFKAAADAKYRGKIKDGIDIRHPHIIVIFPSKHPDTNKEYTWDNWAGHEIADVPEWLSKYIEKTTLKGKSNPSYKFGNDYLSRLVQELKNHELNYEEWVQAGMAIHASDPSDAGLALFVDLTQGESYQDGDEEQAEIKWNSFNRDDEDGAISTLTLGYLVRKKGGVVPNPHYESDKEAFKKAKVDSFESWAGEIDDFIEDESDPERLICPNKRAIVKHFNRKNYAYLGEGEQRFPVIKFSDTGKGVLEMKAMQSRGFIEATAEYVYTYLKVMATDVKKVFEPAARVWLESRHKRRFMTPVFDPAAALGKKKLPKRQINLFTGFCKEPEAINNSTAEKINERFLVMIRDVLCGGDELSYGWLLDWLAHLIQFPEQKPTTVPVIIGDQGTGKGLLFDHVMREILGNCLISVQTGADLTARFNEDLSNRLLTFVDEATWRGNKTEDGRLKNLIGGKKLKVEIKNGPKFEVDNYSRYIIASNNEEAAAVERSNRRYGVIECANRFAGDTEYFGPIWEDFRSNNLSGLFFGFLRNRNIEKFDPYQIPQGNTKGKTAKVSTEGAVAQFWCDLLLSDDMNLKLWRDERYLNSSDVFPAFSQFLNEIKSWEKGISRHAFWNRSKKIMPVLPGAQNKRFGEEVAKIRMVSPLELVDSLCKTLVLDAPDFFENEDYVFDENAFS